MPNSGMKSATILPPERKVLLICRHAKSSWQDPDLDDFQRPLNHRGLRDAPEMGRRLAALGLRPDLIMTSPAVRALSTALHYAAALAYPEDRIEKHPEQYAASPAVLLGLLKRVAPQMRTVLLVGHNPESTALANWLGQLSISNIPTSGIVALALTCTAWHDLVPGAARLLFFDYPKKLQ